METKICSCCGKDFPLTTEYYKIDKRNPKWIDNICRNCIREKSKVYHLNNLDKSKQYRESHKDELKVKKHLDYLKNKTKRNEQGRLNYQQNKDRYHQQSATWKKNNPLKIIGYSSKRYQKVKDKHKLLIRAWKQDHKEERNIAWQLRRSKKLSLEYTLTLNEWIEIKLYFDNKCCYCGRELKLTQDHFIPLDKNGSYSKKNIVPSCLSCNCSKTNKDFHEWYPNYKYYSKEREARIMQHIELTQTVSRV